jgi:hypothetical protein
MSKLPLKVIKDSLRKYYNGEISLNAVLEVREIVEYILDIVAESGAKEFHLRNRRLQEENQPIIRRLDDSIFITISETLFKGLDDSLYGSQRKINVYSDSTDAGELV